jgi:hypothetical protein
MHMTFPPDGRPRARAFRGSIHELFAAASRSIVVENNTASSSNLSQEALRRKIAMGAASVMREVFESTTPRGDPFTHAA